MSDYQLYIQTKGTFEGDRSVTPSASGQIVAPDGWNTDFSDAEELNMLEDKNWDYGKEQYYVPYNNNDGGRM